MPKYEMVPLDLVDVPELPSRALLDQPALDELAEDIKLKGVKVPVHLIVESGRYRVVAGHRRTLASRLAYRTDIPALVYEPGEEDGDDLMLTENMFREEVTAAEQGWWILQLVEKKGCTMEQLCRLFKRSEDWVNERVRLVQTDAVVARAVADRQISMSIAKELLRVTEEKSRHYFLQQTITHGANTKTVNFWVDNWKRDQERQMSLAVAGHDGSTPPAPAAPDNTPHCILCGMRDAPQNLVQVLVHFYHWNPVKKFLRDSGVELFEAPKE